jgi:hypothetical protein
MRERERERGGERRAEREVEREGEDTKLDSSCMDQGLTAIILRDH